jgi:hypothetical protein
MGVLRSGVHGAQQRIVVELVRILARDATSVARIRRDEIETTPRR